MRDLPEWMTLSDIPILEFLHEHDLELPPTPLVECPGCGVVGLPERIAVHDCL
jgi:hypothetical protein